MNFAYIATPGSKESFQLFRIAVAMFLEGGVIGVKIVVWYAFVIYICDYRA